MIKHYGDLPDSMSAVDLSEAFAGLLQTRLSSRKLKADFMSSLLELSDRQWHTYANLSEGLKKRTEEVLISSWDGSDLDSAEAAIIACSRLGLTGFFDFIKSRSALDLSPEVFAEINSAIAEFGNDVSNPYDGMPGA